MLVLGCTKQVLSLFGEKPLYEREDVRLDEVLWMLQSGRRRGIIGPPSRLAD